MSTIQFQLSTLNTVVEQTAKNFQAKDVIERIWEKDYELWRSEEIHKKSILTRLGWLESPKFMEKKLNELEKFSLSIHRGQFTHVVVLGMGGSSLCSDVCRIVFNSTDEIPQLLVLDSTNPTSILRIENSVNLRSTLFIVASKSGSTIETATLFLYFYEKVKSIKRNPEKNFVAITDPNTEMEKIAKEKEFRNIFLNPKDIGGRYSALSYFGLVPMAAIGMDVKKIMESAMQEVSVCKKNIVENPAAMLGIAMGEAEKQGRNKLTFVLSSKTASMYYWIEQLVAESTGKEGKGILPIEYEVDIKEKISEKNFRERFFIFLVLKKDKNKYETFQKKLLELECPFVQIELDDVYELGGQFFLWEFATAISAMVSQINPFDEPNVTESKEYTRNVLEDYKKEYTLPKLPLLFEEKRIFVYGENNYEKNLHTQIVKHCTPSEEGNYIAVLAYIDQNPRNEKLLLALREALYKKFSIPVTIGFGPRYLHSTGQLHKGGMQKGKIIIIRTDEILDAIIPDEQYSFGVLYNAQLLGDYKALHNHSLPVLVFRLSSLKDGMITLRKEIEKIDNEE